MFRGNFQGGNIFPLSSDKLIFHVNLALSTANFFPLLGSSHNFSDEEGEKSFLSTLPSIFGAVAATANILLKEQTPKLQPLELMRKAV
jgi:hypothetical protein